MGARGWKGYVILSSLEELSDKQPPPDQRILIRRALPC